jgi:uncharacterized protein YeaO (DUF488 family)/DNA-binding MarR family transcriptional regulator
VSLSDDVYVRLLALRTGLRRFERWSEQQAHDAGLTPAQHQLLLAIRGHEDPRGPTIGDVADYLLLKHHSIVGLVDRAEDAGLVIRTRDEGDHRIVRLRLSQEGLDRLEALSELHLQELTRLAPQLPGAWEEITTVRPEHRPPEGNRPARRAAKGVDIARVYEPTDGASTYRVLVDRLWPRGLARSKANFDDWMKDIAPSTELRQWYHHEPDRFDEFVRRYREELGSGAASDALVRLRARTRKEKVTLLTATKDLDHSGAAALQSFLAGS